jgi:hypothetical protein
MAVKDMSIKVCSVLEELGAAIKDVVICRFEVCNKVPLRLAFYVAVAGDAICQL